MVIEVRPTLPEDVVDTSDNQQQVLRTNEERPGSTKAKKPRWWRAREKQEQSHAEEEKPKPETPEKPISRAERRRRIKEEIQKLSQGDQKGYYQRRLW